ncbi:MAG TPA: hypothetical protein V6C97_10835 [Oculatellaceae cyanobacterium]
MNLEIPELPAIPETPDLKKYFLMGVTAIAINALVVLALALKFTPMIAAKCLFIEIAVGIGLACLGVFLFRFDIFDILMQLEGLAEEGRDETVVQMRIGRAQLHNISQRLEDTIHPRQHENVMADLLQHAMPVVQILAAKEKNWLQLGMFGWRLAQDAMRLMKSKHT